MVCRGDTASIAAAAAARPLQAPNVTVRPYCSTPPTPSHRRIVAWPSPLSCNALSILLGHSD